MAGDTVTVRKDVFRNGVLDEDFGETFKISSFEAFVSTYLAIQPRKMIKTIDASATHMTINSKTDLVIKYSIV